jgi:hypothetical protein
MNWTRGLLAVLVLVTGAMLTWLIVLAAVGGGQFSVQDCLSQRPLSNGPPNLPTHLPLIPGWLPWPALVLALCFAGFTAGSLWGHQRGARHVDKRAPRAKRLAGLVSMGAPSTVLQLSLVVLFGVGVVALGWETFAVAHVGADPTRWPITYFVRCADDVVPLQTLAAAIVVSTLVGHWLGTYQASR